MRSYRWIPCRVIDGYYCVNEDEKHIITMISNSDEMTALGKAAKAFAEFHKDHAMGVYANYLVEVSTNANHEPDKIFYARVDMAEAGQECTAMQEQAGSYIFSFQLLGG